MALIQALEKILWDTSVAHAVKCQEPNILECTCEIAQDYRKGKVAVEAVDNLLKAAQQAIDDPADDCATADLQNAIQEADDI